MHIGLVCYEYPPCLHGGVGSFSRDFAEGLASAGHEVTVVGIYPPWLTDLSKPVQEIINGVNVVRLPPTRQIPPRLVMLLDRIRLTAWLRKYSKKKPFDIIEAPEASGWLAFGSVPKVPLVLRLHGSQIYLDDELRRPGTRSLHQFERMAISRADFLVAVSDYVGKRTIALTKSTKKYTVIYNAVDTFVFSPNTITNSESGLVVYVGSLDSKKGLIELIKAMQLVWEYLPTAQLIMVGKEGEYRATKEKMSDYLISLVEPHHRENVVFTGHISHERVVDYLRKATVCCYPSHAEAFSLAPLEAMSVGKPVIFMSHGSGIEAIEDGVSGLLCDTRSPDDIANKIIKVLGDSQLAQRLGENARQRVLERFDKHNWIKTNLEFYQKSIQRHESFLRG